MMHNRPNRAGSVALVAALAALGCSGAHAAPPTPHKESSLLGVRLRATFSDVLKKFGQPHEIQVGEPTVSAAAQGGVTGGNPGMPGMMPGRPGGMPGMPGMGGGMPGMPGMMPGRPGMSGGMPGGSGGPGLPGFSPSGSSPGGMPGMMPGRPGMSGGMPGMAGGMPGGYPGMPGGMPGMSGGYGSATDQGVAGVETTWWYHFPKLGLHYSFLFNQQGRVIQIQAYGYKPSSKIPVPRTAEGITLGAPLGQVIRRYGWSNDGEHVGDYVVLRYGGPDQIAFQSKRNQIIGIVLGVVDK